MANESETSKANARLIAAAPDMLAALRDIVAMGEAYSCICGPESPAEHWTNCPRAYSMLARAAIAKATGQD